MNVTIYNLFDVDNKPGYTAYTTELDVLLPYSSYQTVTVAIPECLHPETFEGGRVGWAKDLEGCYRTIETALVRSGYSAGENPMIHVDPEYVDFAHPSSSTYGERGWIRYLRLEVVERGPITPYTPPKNEEHEGEFYFGFFGFEED